MGNRRELIKLKAFNACPDTDEDSSERYSNRMSAAADGRVKIEWVSE